MTENTFPPGWDQERVNKVIAHYDTQSDDQAVAEDESAIGDQPETIVSVPIDLVPAVRNLIGKQGS